MLRETLAVFLLSLSASTALVTLVGVSRHLIDHGVSASLLVRVVPFLIPSMLPFTIPASFLLALILVFGRMSADSELLAVKAAGINLLRLTTLPLILGALLSWLTFVLTDQVAPWAATRIEFAVMDHVEDMLVQQLNNSEHVDYAPANLRISVADMEGERMIRPVIQQTAGQRPFTLVASAARLDIDAPRRKATLHVQDATVSWGGGNEVYLAGDHSFPISGLTFQQERPTHFLPVTVLREKMNQERQTIRNQRELFASGSAVNPDGCLWTIRYARAKLNKLRTEFHCRYALACSCLCFAMFGCPLAAVQARGTLISSLLFCFLPIVGAYYTIILAIGGQCRAGNIDPAWAMWVGNAVLVGLAAWFFYRLAAR